MGTTVYARIAQARRKKETKLDLSNQSLEVVPEIVWTLTHLEELNLSKNSLRRLPSSVGSLRALVRLDLSENALEELPPAIREFQALEFFDLSSNILESLPVEVTALRKLVNLNLNMNKLKELPSEIGCLGSLRELHLLRNNLTELPLSFANLSNLRHLCCEVGNAASVWSLLAAAENTIEELLIRETSTVRDALPAQIYDCTRLRELALVGAGIRTIDSQIANLVALEDLNLRHNKLETLPDGLERLKLLRNLNLADNAFPTVPVQLAALPALVDLNVRENPLVEPPPEILAQGTPAILSFLRDRQTDKARQWISKLLVVGEGGVGKTALLRTLRGESFVTELETTHGIEVRALKLAHPTLDASMTLNCWDFGGQEIYHATHQFFLTDRSLFLLVWNARTEAQQARLEYWLDAIQSRAPGSPVLLIATHLDERTPRLALKEIQERYPQVSGQWNVSCKTGEGVEQLRCALSQHASKLPHMGRSWPRSWLSAAESLRQREETAVDPCQFKAALAEHGVPEKSIPILTQYLHDLGDILFFQDDPELQELVILQPNWATRRISAVLESKEVSENAGVFTRQDMERVWSDVDWQTRRHLLRLMERFDLSYRTLEDRETSLVVELLPLESSAFRDAWTEYEKNQANRRLRMYYRFERRIPAGIPSWFIARCHRFTTGRHWAGGAIFADLDREHQALVFASESSRVLELRVAGPMPSNFFAVLRDGLELILGRYPGLKLKRLVPCPGHGGIDCTHEFDFEQLQSAVNRSEPVPAVQCPVSFEMVPVGGLLYGIVWRNESEIRDQIDLMRQENSVRHKELLTILQREFLNAFRRDQTLTEPACPKVFVLRPKGSKSWLGQIGKEEMCLQLYCEAPGAWHPAAADGAYIVSQPAKWLRDLAPYVQRLVTTIKYVNPLLGPTLGVAFPNLESVVREDVKLMSELVKKLPEIEPRGSDSMLIEQLRQHDSPCSVTGHDLRTLWALLTELDPAQDWCGLRRILTPEGDHYWLCEEHAREFYPGPPSAFEARQGP